MAVIQQRSRFAQLIVAWALVATAWEISLASALADEIAPAAKAKPKITIGKETTYITAPLRPDGYPDYVAALNERMSKGVTPENNAAVLLQKAFGPNEIPAELRKNFFRQLGIDSLPEKGDYFVTRAEMIKRRATNPANAQSDEDELERQFDVALERPWTANELPMIAEWLRLNEKPLQLALEASRRPKRYFPVIIKPDDLLINAQLPHEQMLRDIACALVAKSLLLAKQEKVDDAWQHLLACHRFARLTVDGSSLVNCLVGYTLEAIATRGDVAFWHGSQISPRQFAKMKADLIALGPIPNVTGVFEIAERFMYLDSVSWVSQRGLYAIRALTGAAEPDKYTAKLRAESDAVIDWNVCLTVGNQWYDRLVSICSAADPATRKEGLQRYEQDLKLLAVKWKEPRSLGWDLITKRSAQEVLSPRIANIFLALLMPALQAAIVAHQRTELLGEMRQTALALAEYRSANGSYPGRLTALVPKYIAQVPVDTFRENLGPIGYRRERDAYVLWTVHINGIDDEGRDEEDEPTGDDDCLRPVPRSPVNAN